MVASQGGNKDNYLTEQQWNYSLSLTFIVLEIEIHKSTETFASDHKKQT